MAIKKVKLNYRSAVPKTVKKNGIGVSSSQLEELDRAIKQKIKQNEAERAASLEVAGRYTVR